MHIYRITNTSTSKVYIGKTTVRNIEMRWKDHRNKLRRGEHVNIHLQRSYDLHGKDAFVYEILETCADIDALNDAETVNIIRHRSANKEFGYNMSFGGEGTWHSPETRRKISDAAKQRVGNKNPFFGKTHSTETRQKIAKASKKNMTPEHIRKMVANHKPMTPEHIDKVRIAASKPRSDETKKRISAAKKLYWASKRNKE